MAQRKRLTNRIENHYPDALTAKDIAEILNVSSKTAYNLLLRGEIPSLKIGKTRWVSKAALIQFLCKDKMEKRFPKP